jgi:hypothetical protein
MVLLFIPGDFEFNEVKGKIKLSQCGKVLVQGTGYNEDGTEIMHSDDPLGYPDRNVIISLHPIDFKPKLILSKDAFITQTEQTFIPNILPIVAGSKVHFLNEDEFFHNIQSFTPKSRFNIGRRAPGISYGITIKKVGIIDLMCDIHSHMNARILSFDTPYFCRINENGTYSLKHIPDGKYRIEIFHPQCNKITDVVEIKGSRTFNFDYDLSVKP